MNKQEHESLKKSLEAIQEALRDGTLQGEDRTRAEQTASMISGRLLSNWLPIGIIRKVIMFTLFLAGVYGLSKGAYYVLILWVMASMFSPRLTGEVLNLFGNLKTHRDASGNRVNKE